MVMAVWIVGMQVASSRLTRRLDHLGSYCLVRFSEQHDG